MHVALTIGQEWLNHRLLAQSFSLSLSLSVVCFELLAVYVSVKGLRTGATSLSERHEFIAHVTCALAGLIAFSVYFSECKARTSTTSFLDHFSRFVLRSMYRH